jgi:hypothetical protein
MVDDEALRELLADVELEEGVVEVTLGVEHAGPVSVQTRQFVPHAAAASAAVE